MAADSKQTAADSKQTADAKPVTCLVLPGTAGAAFEARKQNTCWYFAIGSMMNPVSLQLREIQPIESYAGEIDGWELVFKGAGGMGSVDEKQGAVLYGVLHRLVESEMAMLDKMEASYKKVALDCKYGDGKVQKCMVYQMDPTKLLPGPNNPPGERYIDIITQGAQHYKVNPAFVEWLKTVKVTPRKKPSEFKKLPAPKVDQKISKEDLAKHDGSNNSEMWMSVNFKVCKWVGDLSLPQNVMMYEFCKRWAGKEATIMFARGLYEPRYPIPTTLEAMPEEHRALIEDQFAGWQVMREPAVWQVIGSMQQTTA